MAGEIYDLSLSAPLGLGLTLAGIFHKGAQGLLGLNDQATFIAVTHGGGPTVFAVICGAMVIVAVDVTLFGPKTRRLALEQI